jgi:hypothetical protein
VLFDYDFPFGINSPVYYSPSNEIIPCVLLVDLSASGEIIVDVALPKSLVAYGIVCILWICTFIDFLLVDHHAVLCCIFLYRREQSINLFR